jgi:hypothetical protein
MVFEVALEHLIKGDATSFPGIVSGFRSGNVGISFPLRAHSAIEAKVCSIVLFALGISTTMNSTPVSSNPELK